MTKRYIPFILLIAYSLIGEFQSLVAQELISSQGKVYSNSNGSISFSLGEPVISTLTGSNNEITQGYQQIYDIRSQVQDTDCGTTPSSFVTKFYCIGITGATGYVWEFTDIITGVSYTATRSSGNPASTDMTFKWADGTYSWVCTGTCLPSTPGVTYSVKVKPIITNGAFGNSCLLTTPCLVSELSSNHGTNGDNYQTDFSTLVTSFNTKFYCDKPLGGTTGYTWRFTNNTPSDPNFGEIYYAFRTTNNMTFGWANGGSCISINSSICLPLDPGITYTTEIKPDGGCYGDPYDIVTPTVTTQLSSNWQGNDYVNDFSTLVLSFGHKFYCDIPVGGATGYTWKFENITTGDVNYGNEYISYRSANKYPNAMTFGWANGGACQGAACLPLDPGITYDLKIKPNGGSYGTGHQVTTPSVTTQLSSNWLGNDYVNDFSTLVPSVKHKFYCDEAEGNPAGYYWKFTEVSSPYQEYIAYRAQNQYSNAMTFSWANGGACSGTPCLPQTGGKSYTVQIKPDITGGVYGTGHVIATPSTLTNVTSEDCITGTFDWAEKFYCEPVTDAINYEWKFDDGSNIYLSRRGNSSTNMTFKWASLFVCYQPNSGDPCLPDNPGGSYDVSVRPIFNTSIGDYDQTCTLTQSLNKSGLFSNQTSIFSNQLSTNNIQLNIYPNPNDGKQFFINTYGFKSSTDPIVIQITDMYGKLIYEEFTEVTANQMIKEFNFTNVFADGIYLIKVSKGDASIIQRMLIH